MTDAASLEIDLLGLLTVRVNGVGVAVSGSRRRALIARLAVASGEVVRTERLVDDLWEIGADDRSAASLRTYVAKLRKVLGPAGDRISSEPGGYRLVLRPGELDIDRLESLSRSDDDGALDQAISLCRSPALDEFADAAWAHGDRARLDSLRLHVARRHAERAVAHDPSAAIGELEQLTRDHPFDEHLASLHVIALYRSGRPAEALTAQRRAVALLRNELGLDPGPELMGLEHEVLSHFVGAAGGAPLLERSGPPPRRTHEQPLLGRVKECRLLVDLMTRAGGSAQLVIVRGEPGIGKTRLVDEACRIARLPVGWTRCDRDIDGPFEALVRAVGQLGEVFAQSINGSEGTWADEPSGIDPTLVRGLAGVLRAAARVGPIAIVLDDAHELGPSTWTAVRAMVTELADARVSVVATVRSLDPVPSADVGRVTAALRRRGAVHTLDLHGLEIDAVAELLTALDAPRRDALEVCSFTGGNPYFIAEIAHWSEHEQLPDSILDVMGARLVELSPTTTSIAAVASIAGVDVELDVLGEITGCSPESLVTAVEELAGAGIVVEGADAARLRFRHGLARSVVEAGVSPARRRLIRSQLAAALIRRREARPAPPGPIAAHLEAAGAGFEADALHWRILAGSEAAEAWAFDDAAEHFELACSSTALDERGRLGLLLDLAAVLARAGRMDAACDAVAAAADTARRLGDVVALANAALWSVLGGRGASGWHADERRRSLLTEALGQLDPIASELRVRLAGELALAHSASADRGERERLAQLAIDMTTVEHGGVFEPAALPASRVRFWRTTDRVARRGFVERVLTSGAADDPWLRVDALDYLRTDTYEAGDLAAFDRATVELLDLAARHPSRHLRWRAAVATAHQALIDGRLDDVATLAGAALAVWGEEPAPDAMTALLSQLATARLLAGDLRGAAAVLGPMDATAPRVLVADAARAAVAAMLGDLDTARAAATQALADGLVGVPYDSGFLMTLGLYAEAVAHIGDRQLAEILRDALLPGIDLLAVMIGPGVGWSAVASSLGRLELALGHHGAARDLLAHGAGLESQFGLVAWAARSRAALAQLM